MRLATEGTDPTELRGLESPSLFSDVSDGPAAFELKFLLDEATARQVEERARTVMVLDEHADPARGNAYPIISLYTDTPEFDVYRRSPGVNGCKYRVRRYGASGPIFVEQKIKIGDRVRKRRSPAADRELHAIGRGEDVASCGWFHNGIRESNLRPVCRIAYDRIAYLGTAEGNTIRVTFDRNVRGVAADRWEIAGVDGQPELLPGEVICEFKFRLALPGFFKSIVSELALAPSSVSKYRRYMQTKLAEAPSPDA
jgi:hypothetical protein